MKNSSVAALTFAMNGKNDGGALPQLDLVVLEGATGGAGPYQRRQNQRVYRRPNKRGKGVGRSSN